MKSFLKRKPAQVIAALVMATAVWTMIVGLGLNGIAEAAPPAAKITIAKEAHLVTLGGAGISGLISGSCTGFPELSFAATLNVTVAQGTVSGHKDAVNVVECGSASVPFIAPYAVGPTSGGPFTLGKATVSASLVRDSNCTVSCTIATDKRTVKIVS